MRRDPLLGPHGRKVVVVLCGWEIAALAPRSPLPTLSRVVQAHPSLGVLLIALLAHHWWVEVPEIKETPQC